MIAMTELRISLFSEVLGGHFDALPDAIRTLHARAGQPTYHGEAEVVRGIGWLAQICAWATRLPPSGHGPLKVEILARPNHEQWTRHFTRHPMRSRLWRLHSLLCERLGPVCFGFRLVLVDSRLSWAVMRVSVFGLPLPRRWFAAVKAYEYADNGQYRFEVSAALPLVGPLISYRGWLRVE